ncbi:MAG: hypothetical protein KGJ60_13995 [Verrucomicrobiota bacterium]|nr:hypothetical protein [Verrucomicrobiota bacterium]
MKAIILIVTSCLSTVSTVILSAQTLTTLVEFNGTNGYSPYTMIQGSNGDFYGTTANSIFKMTPQGLLTVLTNLSFTTGNRGVYPEGSLIQGNDGDFYGTRSYIANSTNYAGMIFKMTSEGAMTILTNFVQTNGLVPGQFGAPAGLIQEGDGNFYGTMGWGLEPPYVGAIFKMTAGGTLTTLVNLQSTNGASPGAPPIQAADGNFYGTTAGGGDSSLGSGGGGGTIYKMTSGGILTTLVIFEQTNGLEPFGGLVQANDGNLYGTCAYGGLYDKGLIFRVTTNGALTTLVNFNGTNGARPFTTLIQASDGNFYGTTTEGGIGGGTVFKMTPDGTLMTLVIFQGTNGAEPYGSLVQTSDGNLYGTTSEGGNISYNYPYGDGTIFKITGLNLLPRFESIILTNGTVNLTWNSVSNWTYQVQYKTNLSDANWTDLPGDVLATNEVSSKTEPAISSQRFYRLVLLR